MKAFDAVKCAENYDLMRKLMISLLDDDHGISENAYELLVTFATKNDIPLPHVVDVNGATKVVNGCEGRVYLEEWER